MRIQNPRPCCGGNIQKAVNDRLFPLLEKVSALALGLFSAYASIKLFLPFFLAGTAMGAWQYVHSDAADRIAGSRASSCSQGLLEQLTKVKLPPAVSLLANLSVTWLHIAHHTSVFVPIVGVSLGAWAGDTMGHII